jgi:hypothetical protein
VTAIGFMVDRVNRRDREQVSPVSDAEARQSVMHARQDVRLIAYLLAAILIMLGVIADKL